MKIKDLIPEQGFFDAKNLIFVKKILTECWDKCEELYNRSATQEEWETEYIQRYEDFDEMFYMIGDDLYVMYNDVSAYSCSAEKVPDEDLVFLLQGIANYGSGGVIDYVSKRRGGVKPVR